MGNCCQRARVRQEKEDDEFVAMPQPLTPCYDCDGHSLNQKTLRRRPITQEVDLPPL